MRGLIRVTLLVTVMAATLLSGCGNDQVQADNVYVGATDRAVKAFETEFQQLQASFTPVSTRAQDAATLATLRASVERVVAALARVRPPPKIAVLHARLISQINEYEGAIRTAQKGFDAADSRIVIAARARFSTAITAIGTKISETINAINQKLR